MSETDFGANGGDDLRVAVSRLLAFQRRVMRYPEDIIKDVRDRGNYSRILMARCLDNPLWHAVEEAMRKKDSRAETRE